MVSAADVHRRDTSWRQFLSKSCEEVCAAKKVSVQEFIPDFKVENFAPDAWAELFRDGGVRDVIPVAEHHDGFPMCDCAFTPWDASEIGPKRDIIGELSQSIRKHGIRFGASSHHAFNWVFYLRNAAFDNSDPQFSDLHGQPLPHLFKPDATDYKSNSPSRDKQFQDDWLARNFELVDKYQPDVFWFDIGITPELLKANDKTNPFADHLQAFASYDYNPTTRRPIGIGIINCMWNAVPEKTAKLD